jgi:uncharacterized protein YqcC (DUF446 family)
MDKAKSCMEPDLENMVVEGWVQFGFLPKMDAVRESCDKARCAISNCSFILMASLI